MNDGDLTIDRLLRSASLSPADQPIEMPFGFDTRVVALWRGLNASETVGLAQLLRRVAVLAVIISVITAAAMYRETARSQENNEPFANEFMIADSAIQSEFSP